MASARAPRPRRPGIVGVEEDVWLRIFRLLPPRSLASCSAVCSQWHKLIASSSELWEHTCRLWAASLGLALQEGNVKARVVAGAYHHGLLYGSMDFFSWEAHSGRVNCSQLVLNTLATGSSDNTVKIWSLDTLRCMEEYRVPRKMDVIGVEFDGDKIMAGAGTDVYIWKRGSNKVLRKLGAHGQRLYSLHFIDPELAVGCGDGTIRIFDLYTGRCSLLLRHHKEPVTCMGLSSTLQLLVSGSHDCTVQLSDPASGENIANYLPSSSSGISCLHMLHNGMQFLAGTVTGYIDCWDMRGGTLPVWSSRLGSGLNCLHYKDYGPTLVAAGSDDGKVRVVNTRTGKVSRTLTWSTCKGHSSPVLSARIGTTRGVTCHADGTVGRWTLNQNSALDSPSTRCREAEAVDKVD